MNKMFPVRMGSAGDIQYSTLGLHCLIPLFELLSDAAWVVSGLCSETRGKHGWIQLV